MTVYNELNKIAYIGDTAQTLYPIPFEYISTEDIKVSIYTSGNEFVENWMYSTQYVVEDKNIKILSGYEIDNTKKLLVLRKVDLVQDNKYREGGDFPAKSTETSFDKLTMITQQLQETLDRCVKVEVLDIQSPDELLQSVYDKLDSATTVAQEAIAAADEATIAAERATTAVEATQKQLIQTQEYVTESKQDITNTVEAGKTEINNAVTVAKAEVKTTVDEATLSISDAITQATEDVKQQALDAANEAINDAAATATGIVVDYANNEIKPLLNEIASNAAESAENASESAGLAANESGNAAISATDSQHYAEDSRIWAEGSDSEVNNVDGEHSSKVWSEMAKTSATSAASSAELAKQYGNDKINQTHITNCITEVPQDIKLELNNGTLTLKAGSKVYVPNGKNTDGSLKFDEKITTKDLQYKGYYSDTRMILANSNLQGLDGLTVTSMISGATAPTSTRYMFWYDTTNNIIKLSIDKGVTWTGQYSLPICIETSSSTAITSIDQVFNGFGYIGSTIFALPGVKGLIPDGRNADGSLKNIETTVNKVAVYTLGSNVYTPHNGRFLLNSSGRIFARVGGYDPIRNYITASDGVNILSGCSFAEGCLVEAGVIKTFNSKLPFRAVGYDDMQLKQDKATAVNYGNITNCITEVPQNIKLELNNDTVTLKAGSKVYIPKGKDSSGNNIFSEYTTSSDLSFGASSLGSAKRFVALLSGNIQIGAWSAFTSGTTVPSTGYFYHTSENRMYVNGEVVNLSLPLMFGDYVTQSGFSSIDQVFNGFGYVGSTIFALPGVKGLIPNGRNEDGTLRNIEFVTSKVLTLTEGNTNNFSLTVNQNNIGNSSVAKYDERRNLNYNTSNNSIMYLCLAGSFTRTSGVVSNFTSKLPFRSVDTNDSTWARSKSFPDYTAAISISATGSYTAPCDGVLIGSVTAINGSSELTITIGGTNFICYQGNSSNDYNHTTQTYFPLKTGQGYTVDKLSGTTLRFFPFA